LIALLVFSYVYLTPPYFIEVLYSINVREYRKGNQKWTIQRNLGHGTQDEEKHTQYVFDTTMRKQTQITQIRYTPSYKNTLSMSSKATLIVNTQGKLDLIIDTFTTLHEHLG
jgi:hypothetical protein